MMSCLSVLVVTSCTSGSPLEEVLVLAFGNVVKYFHNMFFPSNFRVSYLRQSLVYFTLVFLQGEK